MKRKNKIENLQIKNKNGWFTKSYKFIKEILAFILIVGSVSTIFVTVKHYFYGVDKKELQIVDANFYPSTHYFSDKDFKGVVFLKVRLKNYGKDPVSFTSAETYIKNTRLVKKMGDQIGEGILTENPQEADGIVINPGESKEIELSDGFFLGDLNSFFENEEFKKAEYIFDDSFGVILGSIIWVDRLNVEFERIYGDAYIEMKLFTNYKKLIKKHKFYLSKGTNFLLHEGALQHDLFMGYILAIIDGKADQIKKWLY